MISHTWLKLCRFRSITESDLNLCRFHTTPKQGSKVTSDFMFFNT
ncbi:hypothetical protein NC99_18160 [Sunxiuqinia dokdonensis]|uniref:Uncharacterized protein n=1 Tax=Sunxiuqinia dokdonensis TaxID=1409788 RepID=A0A0L8VA83_9BACT|nr:hypothetical protein NC99_18160 [Sunxiuqinia dokdonensis]